jgi:pyruvate dehydrogenase E1 component alpha subunit
MGQKLRGDPVVTLAYFGDGSASEGDFHEACNFAGVFQAPVVLFCQNNGIAISVPFEKQAAAPIAARAAGYGFPGLRVDGNDVLAVWKATKEAADRARAGGGPTLIEAMTYRLGPHHTADDPSRYRDPDEVSEAETLDPLLRYRTWILAADIASSEDVATMESEAADLVRRVSEALARLEPPAPENLFEWVFEGPTLELLRQQAELTRFAADAGEGRANGLRAITGGSEDA